MANEDLVRIETARQLDVLHGWRAGLEAARAGGCPTGEFAALAVAAMVVEERIARLLGLDEK